MPTNVHSSHFYRMPVHPVLGRVTLMVSYLVTAMSATTISAQAASDDRLSISLASNEYWDSNFARSSVEDSERYNHSAIGFSLNDRISKQDFSLGAVGNYYRFAERDDLDVDFYEGRARWRSDWSPRVKTVVAWTRDAYAVDRLEYVDKDVVARNEAKGEISLDIGKRVGITLGGRDIGQTHSNDLREYLDYDEQEGFVALTYDTANNSLLALRWREGDRTYVHPDPGQPYVLDFDYRHIELEGSWAVTRKTQVGFTVGRFKRDGEINAGTGTQALIDLDWAMSEKLRFSLRYSHNEPAIGETSDSPAEVRTSRASVAWEPAFKWSLSMSASHGKLSYLPQIEQPARDETQVVITPLSITYRFSETLRFRLHSQWVDRDSPLDYRDYDYTQASLGVAVVF